MNFSCLPAFVTFQSKKVFALFFLAALFILCLYRRNLEPEATVKVVCEDGVFVVELN